MADKASLWLQRSWVFQTENISAARNFKREINMSFCHKPAKRQKVLSVEQQSILCRKYPPRLHHTFITQKIPIIEMIGIFSVFYKLPITAAVFRKCLQSECRLRIISIRQPECWNAAFHWQVRILIENERKAKNKENWVLCPALLKMAKKWYTQRDLNP